MNILSQQILYTASASIFFAPFLSAAVDDNANGLSDVWEQRYNASALQLLGDDDGDGFTNLEECITGTDPYSWEDRPALNLFFFQETANEVEVSFQTVLGKRYFLSVSKDFETFKRLDPTGWAGDDFVRKLQLNALVPSETLGVVRADFWADVNTVSIGDLTGLSAFSLSPDGVAFPAQPESMDFLATGYGARMTMWVEAPESGSYTFFLSSGGPAELYFGNLPQGNDASKIAEVLPAQVGLADQEWETYASQRSDAVSLVAGERYFIEVRYVAVVPSQHVQVGWSVPGISGIEKLDRDDLALMPITTDFYTENSILYHDYDTVGAEDLLMNGGSVIEDSVQGMSGNVERISFTGNQDTFPVMRTSMPSAGIHLYATWLFNMSSIGNAHNIIGFFFGNTGNNQEGPRIDLQIKSGVAVVEAGGIGGNQVSIPVATDQTFRVEFIATADPLGFDYRTQTGVETVAEHTFDIYVSDASGGLVGSATGLTFRDGTSAEAFVEVAVKLMTDPNIAVDSWEMTDGVIAGSGYLVSNRIDLSGGSNFFKLEVEDQDQDQDGLADWEELVLGPHFPFLFFDPETTNGLSDASALQSWLSASTGTPEVSLFGTDAAAFESNYPNTIEDNGQFVISRTGSLVPLTVSICIAPLVETGSTVTVCDGSCCMLIGSAGDEEAEAADYILTESDGTVVTDSVTFAFGEERKVLTLTAVDDGVNEYPETVNLAIKVPTDGSYTISSTQNGASIQIFDLPDSTDNVAIFVGAFSQDGRATTATTASGSVIATINGPRTEMRIWSDYSGLTSLQSNSHVHKATAGNQPGSVVYGITETVGDPSSSPLHGRLEYYPTVVLSDDPVPVGVTRGDGYPWDLTQSSLVVSSNSGTEASKQVIIDSLFGQSGETPLYFNVHTMNNPDGEIWAFLQLTGGSSEDPGGAAAVAIPGSAEYPQLAGSLLETEVRRFLNQATFGATESMVSDLLSTIEAQRIVNPAYHRNEAYSDWMDAQMDPQTTQQSYWLDYLLATYFQRFKLAGSFDPIKNPGDGTTATPTLPSIWPTVDRSDSNPDYWYLSEAFPLNDDEFDLGQSNGLGIGQIQGLYGPHMWQVAYTSMLNARDQLRQKMGYALQQINVVSAKDTFGRGNHQAFANYQDQLNFRAFDHYRDVLGYVNWSPVMAEWLSSLRNQKAIDFDGDGLFDTYPDENLARENMQLFSIGLFKLWSDGTLMLNSQGLPEATYTNDDIREFSRIITGHSYSIILDSRSATPWGGVPYQNIEQSTSFTASARKGLLGASSLYPTKIFGEYHSLGAKTFTGTTIDNSHITDLSAQGAADVEDAIDWLAGKPDDGLPDYDMVNSHMSTPAFISRRLIQRFTTSNPSQEYLHRVATVFKNSEGDLGLTLKAILLDPEARSIDISDEVFGMKKSPLEGFLQLIRSTGAFSYIPFEDPAQANSNFPNDVNLFDGAAGDFSNPDLYLGSFGYPQHQLQAKERNTRFLKITAKTSSGSSGLQMNPMYQDSVFNFYLPDYNPGGVIAENGLVAPELQLANEQDMPRNINYFNSYIRSAVGPNETNLINQTTTAFNSTGAGTHDRFRIPRQALADAFFPSTEPTPGITNITMSSDSAAPHWVRLSRVGDVFTSYESSDGVNWTMIQTWSVSMAQQIYVGLALTSHNDGVLATAAFDDVTATGGDNMWLNQDIGAVAATGSVTTIASDQFELQGSGVDIWDQLDEFHFMYQSLDGDGEITAQVTSLTNTHVWAKAGVMMRNSLSADSVHVMTLVSAANGVASESRMTSSARSSESIADEVMLDALDMRLTSGLFKLRFPYDPSNDDDPSVSGVDDLLKNPRELIIDAMTNAYGDPYDGSGDSGDRLNKFADALYLLTFAAEYQIRK
ncbi:MAG: DUF1800 family protein [Lentimonas sp.]